MVCVGGMAKDSSVAPPVARATASVEALDLSTMQWSGAGCMPALPDPRARPSMSLAADGGDSVMVFCGYNHGVADPMHHLMKTALRWSPGGSEWASLPDLPEERQGAVSVGLPDGRTLVIGGFVEDLDDADDQGHVMASVVARAAGGSEWSALAPMAQARSDAAAVVLPDGKVLVAGGYSTDQDDAALETARALRSSDECMDGAAEHGARARPVQRVRVAERSGGCGGRHWGGRCFSQGLRGV